MTVYECNQGYQLVPKENNHRVCLDSGNWSHVEPQCVAGNESFKSSLALFVCFCQILVNDNCLLIIDLIFAKCKQIYKPCS